MPVNLQPTNRYHQALETDDAWELNDAVDFGKYGITSAIASGAISIYNTGVAALNAIGFDTEMADTSSVLASAGMLNTANYYDEHKQLLDGIGFAATTLVPGALGLKALKYAQTAMAGMDVAKASKLTLGIRAALVPQKQADVLMKAIKSGKIEQYNRNRLLLQSAKEGTHQAFVESLFAETAILLTMNQNPTINPDNLSYLDAIKDNLGGAGIGLAFGTGIGGAINSAIGYHSLRKMGMDAYMEANGLLKHAGYDTARSRIGTDAGDRIAVMLRNRAELERGVEALNKGAVAPNKLASNMMSDSLKQMEIDIKQQLETLTDGFDSKTTNIVGGLWDLIKNADPDDAADFLSNAVGVENYYARESLLDPSVGKLIIAETGADYREALATNWMGKSFKDLTKQEQDTIIKHTDGSMGLNYQPSLKARDNISLVDWSKHKDLPEAELRHTIYHELGHGNANRLADMVAANPLGIKDQMVKLSRIARPSGWRQVDGLEVAQNRLLKMMEDPNATVGDIDDMHQYIRYLEQQSEYYNNPKELLADSWALFNDPSRYHEAVRLAPDAYRAMVGNFALKQRLGEGEALLDLKTAKLHSVTDRTPTVADIGNPLYDAKLGMVSFGTGSERRGINVKKPFNVLTASAEEASAYYFAAAKNKGFLSSQMEVDWTDFATINRVLAMHKEGLWKGKDLKLTIKDGKKVLHELSATADDASDIKKAYSGLKKRALQEIRNNPKTTMTDNQLARVTDVSDDYATQGGYNGGIEFWSDVYNPEQPTVAKIKYKNRADAADTQDVQAMADVLKRVEATALANKTTIYGFFGKLDGGATNALPKAAWESGHNAAKTATQFHSGAGVVSTAQGEYGDITSFVQLVGESNNALKGAMDREIFEGLNTHVINVINDTDALYEGSILDSVLRRDVYKFAPHLKDDTDAANYLLQMAKSMGAADPQTTERMINKLVDAGVASKLAQNAGDGSIWGRELTKSLEAALSGRNITSKQIEAINRALEKSVHTIKSAKLRDLWKAKVNVNGRIVEGKRAVATVRGNESALEDGVLYPGPLNTKLYSHVKFIYPKKQGLYADNKPSIIASNTAEGLAEKEKMIREGYGNEVDILTREEIETSKKYLNEYDSDLALTDFHVDSALMKKGIMSDALPEPNEQIFKDYISHMQREGHAVIDNLTAAHYGEELAMLEHMDNRIKMYNTGPGTNKMRDNPPTPFEELTNMMLNRETKGKHEAWKTAQQKVDKMASKIANTISSTFRASKETVHYEKMNEYMEQYNIPTPFSNEVGEYLKTTKYVPEATIKEAMPRLNALASTLMLRLDGIQQIVNAFSLPVTAVPEMKHLIASLPQLQKQQVVDSLTTLVPDGTGARMPSNMKLMMQATKDFFADRALVKQYEEMGLTPSIVRELQEGVNDLTANFNVFGKSADLSGFKKRFEQVKELALKPSEYSESYVKFVAARMADLALTAGGIVDEGVKRAAMLTYVKRVHANYRYSQRPTLFQGFAGQAIGLFQTYQFNLFQQFLRHVGNKELSSATSMVGLQAGIFGAQSVPGFQAMSQYIGEKSQEGTDFYTGANDLFGNEAAEWMLYGLSSNFTKPIFGQGIELYTRGDLTPRTPILLPTSLEDVPVVSLSTKFFSSMAGAANSIAGGVPIDTVFWEALSQNGINRPLAGLGQMMLGGRLTSQGSMLAAAHDLNTWQITTRLLGSRDLDESIATQAFYRAKGYETARNERIQDIGYNAKKMIRSGDWDAEVYTKFMDDYVDAGGRQEYFNKWMHNQAMSATDSQISEMYKANESPSGRYMQRLLGGNIEEYLDVKYE